MTAAIVPISADIERVLVDGDLSSLNPQQRTAYYGAVCDSLGLNKLTKPFAYIKLNGKLTLYATRDCTDQLRKVYKVSIAITARENINGVYVVTARATMPDGRTDESTGAVTVDGLKGESLSNALMKAETKAKRRATLSICSLGMLDESEVDSIKGAQVIQPEVEDLAPQLQDSLAAEFLTQIEKAKAEAEVSGIGTKVSDARKAGHITLDQAKAIQKAYTEKFGGNDNGKSAA